MSEITGTNGLTLYRSRDEIKELTERLQATMPGGRKLNDIEARSLAQLSLAHGLDPFNGEAWMIPNSGLMVGIKGLRRSARRASSQEGGTFWGEYRRVQPEIYNEPETSIVYEYHLRDTVTVQAWSKSIHAMTSAGVPYAQAVEALGSSPVVIGVGIAKPNESSRMEIHKRAKKRAEADALKQRYDVDFGPAQIADEDTVFEAEFSELPRAELTNGEKKSELEILSELGFDVEDEPEQPSDQPQPENGKPNIYAVVVEAGLSANEHSAKKALDKCSTGYATPELAIAWMQLYRGWRDMGADSNKAAKFANAGEVPH